MYGSSVAIDVLPSLFVNEADFRGSQTYDGSVALKNCFDAPGLATCGKYSHKRGKGVAAYHNGPGMVWSGLRNRS